MDAKRILLEKHDSTWSATSPDIAGWTVIAETREEVKALASESFDFMGDSAPFVFCEGFLPSRVQVGVG